MNEVRKAAIGNNKINGVYTAIATPFSEDATSIDYESVDRLLKLQIESGVTGIVIAGSTGEAATLSDVEYGALIRYIIDRVEGKLICIAGVNSSSTAKAVELASRAMDAGAQKLLVVNPPYNKPTQEGIIRHFEAVHTATHAEIMAYNVPGRTAGQFLPETINTLYQSGLISSIKESSASVDNAIDIMSASPELKFFSGDDSLALPLISLGALGVVSVASNVAPAAFTRLCDFALSGDYQSARIEHFKILPLVRALFRESNPIAVKAALQIQGVFKWPSLRLPLCTATEKTFAELKQLL